MPKRHFYILAITLKNFLTLFTFLKQNSFSFLLMLLESLRNMPNLKATGQIS